MSLTIVDVSDTLIAGLPFAGPFEALVARMPEVWRRFMEVEDRLSSRLAPEIRYDVGREFAAGDAIGGRTYLECVGTAIAGTAELPHGMIAVAIGGRYATVRHQGPMTGVVDTYRALFGAIEAAPEWRLDPDRARFERYDDRYLPARDPRDRAANAYDIFLPVRPAES